MSNWALIVLILSGILGLVQIVLSIAEFVKYKKGNGNTPLEKKKAIFLAGMLAAELVASYLMFDINKVVMILYYMFVIIPGAVAFCMTLGEDAEDEW